MTVRALLHRLLFWGGPLDARLNAGWVLYTQARRQGQAPPSYCPHCGLDLGTNPAVTTDTQPYQTAPSTLTVFCDCGVFQAWSLATLTQKLPARFSAPPQGPLPT